MFPRFNVGVLSWIAFVVGLGVFFLLLPGLISISYHPKAPGIHLIPVRIVLAAIGALAFFVLAIRHSRSNRQIADFRKICELISVPIFLWIIFHVTAVIYQQPDDLRLTYGGNTYAIPRIYQPGQSPEHFSYEFIRVSICFKNYAPVYERPCSAYSYVTLGTNLITNQFHAHYMLDNAGVTYKGDMISDRSAVEKARNGGNFTLTGSGSETRFLLDQTGQIERFAHCYTATRNCDVSTRTSQGILTFPAHMEDVGSADFWRAEERHWLVTFDGWKCDREDCEGL
ncbi:MAG: hypothetical protein WBC95_00130 [Albidovulum sp.]